MKKVRLRMKMIRFQEVDEDETEAKLKSYDRTYDHDII